MSIQEKAKIGNTVKVNLEQTNDRLTKEVIEVINDSSLGIISDFRITDGKGIGVILKLANGKEQWFFENEIDILDENGIVIERGIVKNEDISLIFKIIKNIEFDKKNKISDLLNPINFVIWLIASLKDNF